MKRNIIIVLCLILLFPFLLVGCGEKEEEISKKSLSELNSSIISAEQGSYHAAVLKSCDKIKDYKIDYVVDSASAVAAVMSGKSDAYITDYVAARKIVSRYDGLTMIYDPLGRSYYSYGFRKGDKLCDDFNRRIKRLIRKNTTDSLLKKWTGEGEKSVTPQKSKGENGIIRLGVNPDFDPICYQKNGEIIGFDIDFTYRIADELGLKVQIVKTEFSDLIPSLIAGDIDVIASGITASDERSGQLDYSDGYISASSVAVIRKGDSDTKNTGFFLGITNGLKRFFVDESRWKNLVSGLYVTLAVTFSSAAFGIIFGMLLFFLGYMGKKPVDLVLNFVLKLHILMPFPTWLFIVYYIIFPGRTVRNTIAAVIALAFKFGFEIFYYVTGMFKKSISDGQKDAAYAMGYTKCSALFKLFLPQYLPDVADIIEEEIIYHVRNASLIELIAVADIQAAADAIKTKTSEPFVPIIVTAVFYISLAYLTSMLIRLLGKIIRKHQASKRSKITGGNIND